MKRTPTRITRLHFVRDDLLATGPSDLDSVAPPVRAWSALRALREPNYGYKYDPSWFKDCLHPNVTGHDQLRRRFYCLITGEDLI